MVKYPAGIDTSVELPTIIDNSTAVSADIINNLRDAIIAIEAELGIKPSGIYTNVRSRIVALELAVANISGGGTGMFGGDLAALTASTQKVVGIQGRSVSALAPSDGQIMTWDATNSYWKPDSASASFTAGGDLSGSSTSQTVIKINGASVPASGALTTNHVLKVSGVAATSYGYIVNANVDAAAAIAYSKLSLGNSIVNADVSGLAAIAGAKISPDFGSQNIITTGAISVGSAPATSGTIRLGGTGSVDQIKFLFSGSDRTVLNTNSSTNVTTFGFNAFFTKLLGNTVTLSALSGDVLTSDTNGYITSALKFGSAPAATGTLRWSDSSSIIGKNGGGTDFTVLDWSGSIIKSGVDAGASLALSQFGSTTFYNGGTNTLNISSTLVSAGVPTIQFLTGVTSPTINQAANTTNSATAQNLAITAQNATGTTSTGGNLILSAGSGTSTNGVVRIAVNGSTGVQITPSNSGANIYNVIAGATSVLFNQSSNTTNSATAATWTIQAANATGTSATGGALALTSGTGTSANGAVRLQSGGTNVITIDSATQVTHKETTTVQSGNSKITITDSLHNVQTTDATVTSAATWTIPTGISQIDAIITAIKSDGSQGASYKRAMTFRNNAGTVSAIGVVTDAGTKEDDSSWDCTIDNSTTTGRVRVTGVAATTIQWHVALRRSEGIA